MLLKDVKRTIMLKNRITSIFALPYRRCETSVLSVILDDIKHEVKAVYCEQKIFLVNENKNIFPFWIAKLHASRGDYSAQNLNHLNATLIKII